MIGGSRNVVYRGGSGRGSGRLFVGLEVRGEGGNLAELAEERRGRRLRKKFRSSSYLRDFISVVFFEFEWSNSFSLIFGWRVCVGRSCWMKSFRCVF